MKNGCLALRARSEEKVEGREVEENLSRSRNVLYLDWVVVIVVGFFFETVFMCCLGSP